MIKKSAIVLLCLLFCALTACSYQKETIGKVSELDFTVLREEEIPQELAKIIEEKKEKPFHVTYEDDALYIAVGYGKQQSGGYSIEARELYLGENTINFHTRLIGPQKDEKVEESASYPYIVVKTEYRDERVVFEN